MFQVFLSFRAGGPPSTHAIASVALFQAFREFFGRGDIRGRRALVAAAQQQYDGGATPDEIQPIARPVVDPKLADIPAQAFDIAGIAEGQTTNANVDARLRLLIAQFGDPIGKMASLSNLDPL